MSIGPLGGIIGSAAGSPLAQTQGSEPERAQQDAAAGQRRTHSDKKAEAAAGIGETDGDDHETEDRDADGRRLWEPTAHENVDTSEDAAASRPSKDATGESGNLLDLSG